MNSREMHIITKQNYISHLDDIRVVALDLKNLKDIVRSLEQNDINNQINTIETHLDDLVNSLSRKGLDFLDLLK